MRYFFELLQFVSRIKTRENFFKMLEYLHRIHKKKYLKCAFIIMLHFIPASIFSQNNFNALYEDLDPASDTTSMEEREAMHIDFLENARADDDKLKIIIGHLYLSNDYIIQSNYTESMSHLVQADSLASVENDTLLLGKINHKKGTVYSLLENNEESIKYYETALRQSTRAGDSLNMAITLEQLGSKHISLKNLERAAQYYEKAMPLVERHCSPKSEIVTLVNYGRLKKKQGDFDKAIELQNQAIKLGEEIEDDYEIYAAKINLAFTYSVKNDLIAARDLFKECIQVYEENKWLDFQAVAYDGLAHTYEKAGNADSAYHYFLQYHYLQDSIVGANVQNQISTLENKMELQKKDIEILTQKTITLKSQQKFKNAIIGLLALFMLGSWVVWYYFHQAKKVKLRLIENRESLRELSNLLSLKNAELRDITTQLKSQSNSSIQEDISVPLEETNFYDMNILTESDWQTFKSLFERSYPKYLQKIRTKFPEISPAEERLFIFIKLQISNKEAANILGVQSETVKKTRTRLRKKLGLERQENLNEFIQYF